MRRTLSLIFLHFILGLPIIAQEGVIEGLILDKETRIPLHGASIQIHANDKAHNSDEMGSFRFTQLFHGKYLFSISHIGYKQELIKVEIGSQTPTRLIIELERSKLDLTEIRLNSKRNNSPGSLSQVDLVLRPIKSSQEVLRLVPGLFIAQHAGGGKAEQIFLRGYDIDHGTDINLSVDGMPVNMVSHAHGQGYADLHFLIPETIEKVIFETGPYNTEKGNLATAGFVDFRTRDFLAGNMVKAEAGNYNMQRLMSQLKLFNRENELARQQLYIASEYFRNKGYFEDPQDFHRLNLMGKYSAHFTKGSKINIIASVFDSKWNASGQIPMRALKSGSIRRFGAIDNTEGGNTSRNNFSFQYLAPFCKNWKFSNDFYYSYYKFNLYSNFSFYLKDSLNGDGIRQRETRNLLGYSGCIARNFKWGSTRLTSKASTGLRFDDIKDSELSSAPQRKPGLYIQRGDIQETNLFAYLDQQLEIGKDFIIHAGLRYDYFRFGYKNLLAADPFFEFQHKAIFSPKFSVNYIVSPTTRIFFSHGIGFHSNDARVILQKDADKILPRVTGTDIGLIAKPTKHLLLKTTIWHMYSQQEFVYVGDEGIVEPAGKSKRMGLDISARYQLNKWLFADADLNLAKARLIQGKDNYIPLAASLTSTGGLSVQLDNGISSSFRYRFIKDRPANEEYTIKARGYYLMDMVVNYRLNQWNLFASMENMLNSEWNEAQFATTSRLKNETREVTELHFTPGSPRFLKAGLSWTF